MNLTKKQAEFWAEPYHRYYIKHGATRTGKTYLDYYMIPRRIRERTGKDGLTVILGNTKGTLQRNVIEPMQKIWGSNNVSSIRTDNTSTMFGETVHCLGADNKKHVDRVRGMSIKYAYGDEVATWNEDVFAMLKSRLDKEYSCFDGTCNPEHPDHWLKKFIDGDADVFSQNYQLDDNEFLPHDVAENIRREYAGTVYYDRFVLGKWVRAQGTIYSLFASNPKKYLINGTDADFDFIQVGVDFGGNKSAYAFVATGIKNDYSKLTALYSERIPAKDITPEQLYSLFNEFSERVISKYGAISTVYCDSAEQALINGMRGHTQLFIRNSIKNQIVDRIRCVVGLAGSQRFYYTEDCKTLKNALCDAVYDDKKFDDSRLDNGTSDIDTLDAFEYSWERYIRQYSRYAK